MSVRQSCSWCHTHNDVIPFASNWCVNCGHRADVARSECNCRNCRETTQQKHARRAQRAATTATEPPHLRIDIEHERESWHWTPGPWHEESIGPTAIKVPFLLRLLDDANNSVEGVWVEHCGEDRSTRRSNRQLALHAPELLAAWMDVAATFALWEHSRGSGREAPALVKLFRVIREHGRTLVPLMEYFFAGDEEGVQS